MPIYTSYELAKIAQENIWFNYASGSEIMKLYEIAMKHSGKFLKEFSYDSLIRFIETTLFIAEDSYDGPDLPDCFEMMESNRFITFDSDKNKIDYRESIFINKNNYEEMVSMWYQNISQSKFTNQFNLEYQVLIDKITPVDLLFFYNFENMEATLSIGDILEYLSELRGIEGDEVKEMERELVSAVKYHRSADFAKKLKVYQTINEVNEHDLFDTVCSKIKSGKIDLPYEPQTMIASLEYVMKWKHIYLEPLSSGNSYGSELSPFSTEVIFDGSKKGRDLWSWYNSLIEIDQENMTFAGINWEYSFLEKEEHNIFDYLNHLNLIV